MRFKLLTINNQAKYEAVIVGITLTGEIRAKFIKLQIGTSWA